MRVAIFRTHKGDWLCRIISALTRGGYTHAALADGRVDGKVRICEAFYPFLRWRLLDPSELDGIDFFEIEGLTPAIESKIRDYCNMQIGRKARYTITNLFRFLPWFRALFGEAKDDGTEAVFCSQFVFDAIVRGGGLPLFSSLVNSWAVDPEHLSWSPSLTKV